MSEEMQSQFNKNQGFAMFPTIAEFRGLNPEIWVESGMRLVMRTILEPDPTKYTTAVDNLESLMVKIIERHDEKVLRRNAEKEENNLTYREKVSIFERELDKKIPAFGETLTINAYKKAQFKLSELVKVVDTQVTRLEEY